MASQSHPSRSRASRPSTALLAALLLLCHLLPVARACSCGPPTNVRSELCAASRVVLADVVASFDNCAGRTCAPAAKLEDQVSGRRFYVLRVVRALRGAPPEDGVVFLRSVAAPNLCGVSLQTGRRYVVALRETPVQGVAFGPLPVFQVGLCFRRPRTVDQLDWQTRIRVWAQLNICPAAPQNAGAPDAAVTPEPET